MAGIYIHIPFCKRKCNYCNFFSVASLKNKKELVSAISQEAILQKNYLNNLHIETIYFGGGTPSILSPWEIDQILNTLEANYNLASDCEISLECNPDDIDETFLAYLKSSSFNRLSLGIQSFRDSDLEYLERSHTAKKAIWSIDQCLNAGFENMSIDLIYGLPNMNDSAWLNNLETFLKFQLPHLSSYALTVEPNTILKWQIEKKKTESPKDSVMERHFDMLMEFAAKHDYEHYEISNFAQDNKYSKHNSSYWKQEPYLGLGPSAHSYNGHSRQWNITSLKKYILAIQQKKVPFESEELSKVQKMNEYILTQIRTIWGININTLESRFSAEMIQQFHENLIQIPDSYLIRDGVIIRLSNKGKLFGDQISASLFIA